MGQSVLRERRNPLQRPQLLFDISFDDTVDDFPKGHRVNIPELRHRGCILGCECGNAVKLGDVGGSPRKSCLFSIRGRLHENSLPGDMDVDTEEPRGSCGVWCAAVGP